MGYKQYQPRQDIPSPQEQFRRVDQDDSPIQILAIYLLFSLFLPWLLLSITGSWPEYYRKEPIRIFETIAVFGAIGFACAVKHILWARARSVVVYERNVFVFSAQKVRIAVLVSAICLAIFNIIEGNTGWRYSEVSLSEQGSISLYLSTIVPSTVKLLLVFHAFIYRGKSKLDVFERLLVTLTLVLSINGNATAFVAVFSLIVLQTPAREYLFKRRITMAEVIRFALLTLAILAFLIVAYIVGEAVKRGESVANVFDWLTGTSAEGQWTPQVAIERTAPSYASLVNALPLTFDWERESFSHLLAVLNNFAFRMDALGVTSFGVDRGSAESMMRFNYEWIDISALGEREGTAPGLIPGFIFCFPPVINLIALTLYCLFVLSILQSLCLCMPGRLSIIGKLMLTYMALPLFESPIDILMIVDDGLISVAGLWWMSRLVARQRHLGMAGGPVKRGSKGQFLPANG